MCKFSWENVCLEILLGPGLTQNYITKEIIRVTKIKKWKITHRSGQGKYTVYPTMNLITQYGLGGLLV